MNKNVWVEGCVPFKGEPTAVRIFRNRKDAVSAFTARAVFLMDRTLAVASIRHQIYLRSHGVCEICGAFITEQNGHMHETKHRGQGGEISLRNSVFICPKCHGKAHADRAPRWSKKKKKTLTS